MEVEQERPTTDKEFVRWRLANDVERLLSTYRNREIGLRLLAEKTNLSEKTLKRVLSQVSDPHSNTLRSFYEYFFKVVTLNEEEMTDYQAIRTIVEKESVSFQTRSSSDDLGKMMSADPIFRQIFLRSRTGLVLRSEIERAYGQYGVKILDLMLKHDVIIAVDKHVYKEGPVTITKNGEIIKKVIAELIENNLNTAALDERGVNSAFYAVEGLSLDARGKLLEKIDEIKKEIFNIMSDPNAKGEERVFVAMAMDSLQDFGGNGADDRKGEIQ